MAIKRIVVTGGPHAGKSSVQERLEKYYGDTIAVVPEAATILLKSGLYPGFEHHQKKTAMQRNFNIAVINTQRSFERQAELIGGSDLILCDRGPGDIFAYGKHSSWDEMRKYYGLTRQTLVTRYQAVYHFPSLAVIDPKKYGKQGNEHRFEDQKTAAELDGRLFEAWNFHPRHIRVPGEQGIEAMTKFMIKEIDTILKEGHTR